MELKLDLSGLETRLRWKILEMAHKMAANDYYEITADLEHYDEGPAKDDMVKWQKQAKAVMEQTQDLLTKIRQEEFEETQRYLASKRKI